VGRSYDAITLGDGIGDTVMADTGIAPEFDFDDAGDRCSKRL
jgi:hypothetical protein